MALIVEMYNSRKNDKLFSSFNDVFSRNFYDFFVIGIKIFAISFIAFVCTDCSEHEETACPPSNLV